MDDQLNFVESKIAFKRIREFGKSGKRRTKEKEVESEEEKSGESGRFGEQKRRTSDVRIRCDIIGNDIVYMPCYRINSG
jgi:hypothetical protein